MGAHQSKKTEARRRAVKQTARGTSDEALALAHVIKHLRKQSPAKLALDGALDAANPTAQAKVWRSLKKLDVDGDALLEGLCTDQATQGFASELAAAQRLRHWKVIAPHYDKLVKLFDGLTRDLTKQSVLLPDSVEELFFLLCEKLSAPARPEVPTQTLSPAEEVRLQRVDPLAAKLRLRIGPVGHTLSALERSLTAIRQRHMPIIRRQVYKRLRPAVEREVHAARRRKFPKAIPHALREQAAGRVNTRTCELTAEFVSAFYPLFGEGTTAEQVRKTVATTAEEVAGDT